MLDAARRSAAQGVILLIGGRSFAEPPGRLLLRGAAARWPMRSQARACVQLDHCDDLEVIEAALEPGRGRGDGRRLGPAVRRERRVRAPRAAELARRAGAAVECELGGITGDEDVAEAVAAGALTDPAQASAVHAGDRCRLPGGLDRQRPRRLPRPARPRLAAARGRSGERGGAALAARRLGHPGRHAPAARIEAGIAKVNVNTELRQAYLAATADTLAAATRGAQLNLLHAEQARAVAGVVGQKMDVLGGKVAA